MATFKEMQDRVLDGSRRAGLTDVTEIKALLNQAYFEISARTRPTITTASITLTAGTADYTLSGAPFSLSNVVALRNFSIADSTTAQTYLLEQCTQEYMLLIRQTQVTAGGQMTYWSQDGLDNVSFFPAPSSTQTALTLTYVARPASLVSDSDVPAGIPLEFHDLIVIGAIARSVRIWKPEIGDRYQALYAQKLAEYRRFLNYRKGAWGAKAVVKGSRQNSAIHGNDIYWSGMDQ